MLRRLRARTAVPALAALLLSAAACENCPHVRQTVVIHQPDETLDAWIENCLTHTAPPGGCPDTPASVPCACRQACQRVMTLIDQFEGDEQLESCSIARSQPPQPPEPPQPPQPPIVVADVRYRVCL